MQETTFNSAAHCAYHIIDREGIDSTAWGNERIAEEIRKTMGTKTSTDSVAWYKSQVRTGKVDLKEYLGNAAPVKRQAVTEKGGTPKFTRVADCIVHLIQTTEWDNKKIAAEVKVIMLSNTSSGNVAWYRSKIKSGYIKVDINAKKNKETKPEQQKRHELEEIIPITDELTSKLKPGSIQWLALDFLRKPRESAIAIASFNALYRRMKDGMFYHAMRVLKDEDSAADVVAEAWIKVWKKLDQYNPHWNFSTWAYKIVFNEALQQLEKKQRSMSMDRDTSYNKEEEDGEMQMNELIKKGANENEIISHNDVFEDNEENYKMDIYNKVMDQISGLPQFYKEIIIDRELNGLKYKQIAKKYSININSVKTRIKRARTQIISQNQEYYKLVQARNKANRGKKGRKRVQTQDI